MLGLGVRCAPLPLELSKDPRRARSELAGLAVDELELPFDPER